MPARCGTPTKASVTRDGPSVAPVLGRRNALIIPGEPTFALCPAESADLHGCEDSGNAGRVLARPVESGDPPDAARLVPAVLPDGNAALGAGHTGAGVPGSAERGLDLHRISIRLLGVEGEVLHLRMMTARCPWRPLGIVRSALPLIIAGRAVVTTILSIRLAADSFPSPNPVCLCDTGSSTRASSDDALRDIAHTERIRGSDHTSHSCLTPILNVGDIHL